MHHRQREAPRLILRKPGPGPNPVAVDRDRSREMTRKAERRVGRLSSDSASELSAGDRVRWQRPERSAATASGDGPVPRQRTRFRPTVHGPGQPPLSSDPAIEPGPVFSLVRIAHETSATFTGWSRWQGRVPAWGCRRRTHGPCKLMQSLSSEAAPAICR